jgi:hypothetical protein
MKTILQPKPTAWKNATQVLKNNSKLVYLRLDVGEAVSLNETDIVLLVEPRSIDPSEMPVNKCTQPGKSATTCAGLWKTVY